MAVPNVSLSVFLTQQFREYAAALNLRFAPPTSRGGLCSLLDGPLQVIKENIAREVGGSAGASVTVDIWSGSDEDDNASTCSDGDLLDFGEDEIDDFEEENEKIGLDMRFSKRLSCMAHTLQLALAGGLKASDAVRRSMR
ncbi:hypothetical protein Tcan_12344 [Toxocara canis]|uniref:Uncharacterized protein n=1 Tax=Toxocara canis TaxID=6265 RepID=A0A0B2US77_TOXCA|nr:hypothetical protein Tcan_12344 [Toxocara canis]